MPATVDATSGGAATATAVRPATETEVEPEPAPGQRSDRAAEPVLLEPRRGLSAAPFVVTLVAALFAINLVGYMPELVLAYRDYNGVSRDGLRVVQEAGLDQAVVFVTF